VRSEGVSNEAGGSCSARWCGRGGEGELLARLAGEGGEDGVGIQWRRLDQVARSVGVSIVLSEL